MQQITFSLRQAAKLTGFPGGRNKFIKWLHNQGYLLSNNEPSQKYVDNGWMTYRLKPIITGMTSFEATVTRVTAKGLAGIERHVQQDFPICKPCPDAENE